MAAPTESANESTSNERQPTSPPAPASAQTAAADQARSAGRGGLAIAVAKVSFILVGFVQQLLFPRILDEAGYGAVSRMLAVVSILNNVVVAMSLQGVSRFVAGAPQGKETIALRKTLHVHVVIALILSIGFALLASRIANYFEAPHATWPLRVGAIVVLCYGVYAPLVGGLNGRRRFLDQAGLDIFYGFFRTFSMVGGAYLFAKVLSGDGSLGAAAGFALAALVILPVAAVRGGIGQAGPGGPTPGEYLRFLLPLMVSQVGLNLLLQSDLLLLSKAAGEQARLLGIGAQEADKLLAPYRANQLFGFLPYQLLMSVQFVLFPLLSKAHADGDAEAVKRLTRGGVRIAFILTGLIGGTLATLAPHLVRFAFPENIAVQGSSFVRNYVLGLSTLAIFGVCTSALASLGKEVVSMALTWLAVGFIIGAILLLRPADSFGVPLMERTAYGTAIGMSLAAVVGAFTLRAVSGSFASVLTVLRVLGSVVVAFFVGSFIPWMGKLLVPVQAAAVLLGIAALLIVSGELGRADLDLIKRVLGRRRA